MRTLSKFLWLPAIPLAAATAATNSGRQDYVHNERDRLVNEMSALHARQNSGSKPNFVFIIADDQ